MIVGTEDPASTMIASIEDLRAQARYHRERYDLYRARSYGSRPTTPARLRELRQASELSQDRLQAARRVALRESAGG